SARDVERLSSLPADSVRTIHHGVPDVPLRAAPRPSSSFVVGSVGRLYRQKGLDVLVDALPAVPEAFALLVGDVPERKDVLARAAAAGVAERISVTGWQRDARNFLTAMD